MAAPLPDVMWTLPREEAIQQEEYRTLFTELVHQLRSEMAEVPGFGVLQQMMVERVVYLYVWLRDLEARSEDDAQARALMGRNYKETLQLWVSMSEGLHKSSRSAVDREEIRNHVIKGVMTTINGVMDTMHPDVADGLRERFAEAFEVADF